MHGCFQSLYDLLDVYPHRCPKRDETFEAWWTQHGRQSWRVSPGLRELHATDLDRWQPDGERRRLRSLTETLRTLTGVDWVPLTEGLSRRFRRSMRPVWFPIAHDRAQHRDLVVSLEDARPDPAVWGRDYIGLFQVGPLVKTARSLLVGRALDVLPYRGWLRTEPVPLVEPAIDWLLDQGATPVPPDSSDQVVWRAPDAVVRVTVDRPTRQCVWFFGGNDADTLGLLLRPLARAGLAPPGLMTDLDQRSVDGRLTAAFTTEVLTSLA